VRSEYKTPRMPAHPSSTRPIAIAVAMLTSGQAWAQNLEIHGTASLSTGYDSNPMSVPDEDHFSRQVAIAQQNPLPEKQGAFVLQPVPGFVVDFLSPRTRWELIYNHPFFFYIGNDQANADADIAAFNLFYDLDPRTQVTLGAFFNRLNTGITTAEAASNSVIAARPGGDRTALSFGANQSIRHEMSEFWHWNESASLGMFVPLASSQPIALIASASTGPELRYGDHGFGLVPSASYLHPVVEDEEMALTLPYFADQQLIATGAARWRWDFALSFGFEASAGVSVLSDLGDQFQLEPVGSAAVNYAEEGYAATLEYRRAFTPNIITGQTYLSDTASLTGRFPIVREHDIAAHTSIGGAFTRVVDRRIEFGESTAITMIGDVAVGWFPSEYPNISLRYQHIEQIASRYEGYRALPTFDRDIFLVTVSYTFPARTIEVPIAPSRRVDDSDRSQILNEGGSVGPRSSGRP
jgi:hypothetical protein